jgi:hypothetical protein
MAIAFLSPSQDTGFLLVDITVNCGSKKRNPVSWFTEWAQGLCKTKVLTTNEGFWGAILENLDVSCRGDSRIAPTLPREHTV